MFRRVFLRLGCVFFLTGLSACTHLPRESTTRAVGVVQVDLTPDYPVRLNGYGGRRTEFEGVEQRIRAKALAIGSDAEGPFILITVDNCGVPEWIRTELLKRLASKRVTSERFAICSSHTHSAPMLNGVLPTIFACPFRPITSCTSTATHASSPTSWSNSPSPRSRIASRRCSRGQRAR